MQNKGCFLLWGAAVVFTAISTGSVAEVYKCKDPTTGHITFTDTACPDRRPGHAVGISSTNAQANPFESRGAVTEKNNRRVSERAAFKSNRPDKSQATAERQLSASEKRMQRFENNENKAEIRRACNRGDISYPCHKR